MFKAFAITCFLFASTALAVTPADKAALQGQAAAVLQSTAKVTQDATALKNMIDLLPLDVVVPPPVAAWPRIAPNMLNIDLVNQDSILKAKWLDGNRGWDGLGTAIHYGNMAGAMNYIYLPDGSVVPDYNAKLSNPSCPPKWGTELNGVRYLETCTDGTKEPVPQYGCVTCRLINWGFSTTPVAEVYWRNMEYIYPTTLTNETDLGIKGTGVGGTLVGGGTFAEIQEYGDKLKDSTRTGFPGQWYRYDLSGAQGVTSFGGFTYVPGKWYTNEGHVKVPTCATCADGVLEFKVDGVLVYTNKTVKMGAAFVTGFNPQLYHGGQTKPSGVLRFKVARIALSTAGWIGPAPELN